MLHMQKAPTHHYDFPIASDANTTADAPVQFVEADNTLTAFINSAGTAGTLGTAGGCFGSFGTFGSYSAAN
jgi:hypothetical protein